jgi:hypothetical protein
MFPLAESTFRQPLFASMVSQSIPAFKASAVAPHLIDLLTPNSAHKPIVKGVLSTAFCWIHSRCSTSASSNFAAHAALPSFFRNIHPETTPTASFSLSNRFTHSQIRNPDPVNAATGRKCCSYPFTCLNLPIMDKVMWRGSKAPSPKYFLTPLSSIFVITSPRNARA